MSSVSPSLGAEPKPRFGDAPAQQTYNESVPGVLAGFSLAKNPKLVLGEHGVGCQEWGCCWSCVTGSCAVFYPPTPSGFAGTCSPSSETLEGLKAAFGVHKYLMEMSCQWSCSGDRVVAWGRCPALLVSAEPCRQQP